MDIIKQIPHYQLTHMKIGNSGNGCSVPCSLLGEVFAWLPLPKSMKISTRTELHYKTQEFLTFEMRVERGQEWMIKRLQNLSLCLGP